MWKFILFLLCSLLHKIEVLVSHEHITGVREANNSSFAFVVNCREGGPYQFKPGSPVDLFMR